MKKLASILLCLLLVGAFVVRSQQTPSQILNSGASFYALGPRDLEVAKVYLLATLAAQTTPTLILSNGVSFYALSDRDLQVAQTYLLSQIQGSLGTNGGNFVLSLNGAATNVSLWNQVNYNANLTATPFWKAAWSDTRWDLTNSDGTAVFQFDSGGNLTLGGTYISTNSLGLVLSNNAYVGGSMTIIGDIGTVQAISVNGEASFVKRITISSNIVFNISSNGIVGDTTGGLSLPGVVGESTNRLLATGSAIALTTAVPTNVLAVTLGAGAWILSGNVIFRGTGSSNLVANIGTTSGTLTADGSEVYFASGLGAAIVAATNSTVIPPKIFNASGSATYFLVGKATFGAGAVSAYGSLTAWRYR